MSNELLIRSSRSQPCRMCNSVLIACRKSTWLEQHRHSLHRSGHSRWLGRSWFVMSVGFEAIWKSVGDREMEKWKLRVLLVIEFGNEDL